MVVLWVLFCIGSVIAGWLLIGAILCGYAEARKMDLVKYDDGFFIFAWPAVLLVLVKDFVRDLVKD